MRFINSDSSLVYITQKSTRMKELMHPATWVSLQQRLQVDVNVTMLTIHIGLNGLLTAVKLFLPDAGQVLLVKPTEESPTSCR
mmetsp:Transcript_50616/g.50996  ORF Transcript_50616/g.50996 Transcript_50616/m.50996 type:complete len:83 (+) Transcript_50616:1096-1344(+)